MVARTPAAVVLEETDGRVFACTEGPVMRCTYGPDAPRALASISMATAKVDRPHVTPSRPETFLRAAETTFISHYHLTARGIEDPTESRRLQLDVSSETLVGPVALQYLADGGYLRMEDVVRASRFGHELWAAFSWTRLVTRLPKTHRLRGGGTGDDSRDVRKGASPFSHYLLPIPLLIGVGARMVTGIGTAGAATMAAGLAAVFTGFVLRNLPLPSFRVELAALGLVAVGALTTIAGIVLL